MRPVFIEVRIFEKRPCVVICPMVVVLDRHDESVSARLVSGPNNAVSRLLALP